jgi:hypothetical protein
VADFQHIKTGEQIFATPMPSLGIGLATISGFRQRIPGSDVWLPQAEPPGIASTTFSQRLSGTSIQEHMFYYIAVLAKCKSPSRPKEVAVKLNSGVGYAAARR